MVQFIYLLLGMILSAMEPAVASSVSKKPNGQARFSSADRADHSSAKKDRSVEHPWVLEELVFSIFYSTGQQIKNHFKVGDPGIDRVHRNGQAFNNLKVFFSPHKPLNKERLKLFYLERKIPELKDLLNDQLKKKIPFYYFDPKQQRFVLINKMTRNDQLVKGGRCALLLSANDLVLKRNTGGEWDFSEGVERRHWIDFGFYYGDFGSDRSRPKTFTPEGYLQDSKGPQPVYQNHKILTPLGLSTSHLSSITSGNWDIYQALVLKQLSEAGAELSQLLERHQVILPLYYWHEKNNHYAQLSSSPDSAMQQLVKGGRLLFGLSKNRFKIGHNRSNQFDLAAGVTLLQGRQSPPTLASRINDAPKGVDKGLLSYPKGAFFGGAALLCCCCAVLLYLYGKRFPAKKSKKQHKNRSKDL